MTQYIDPVHPDFSPRFDQALVYAHQLHARQTRKGTTIPYIGHLLAVAAIVIENSGSEDEVIAALLHDAVEDQGGPKTREEIRQRFGENIAAIVDGLSDTDQMPKPPWRARKEEYIAHLDEASPSVLLVSLADKIHNAGSILRDVRSEGESVWSRFTGSKDGSLWYYRALVEAFRARGHFSSLVAELDRIVTELEELAVQ
ncbi:MAG TPA: HD domain-containing protein [Anaerolineae bacterium]|nr:HD domain-containing protein [Anaerolineae bacterium]